MSARAGSPAPVPFQDLQEVRELVESFEHCALEADRWNHRAHLAVAMWYLIRLREPSAIDRMIRGIRRFNHANGIRTKPRGGYHETMTLFWLGVGSRVRRALSDQDPLTIINRFLEAPRSLPFVCYSEERLWSEKARCQWVEPDLAGLEAAVARVVDLRDAAPRAS